MVRTNVLGSYLNEDVTITLPDDKKISDIKWLSVYDLTRHVSWWQSGGQLSVYDLTRHVSWWQSGGQLSVCDLTRHVSEQQSGRQL